MFLLANGIHFGPPCLERYKEKTKKCSLDVRKKSENVKFLSKLFFYLPLWSQIADLITRLQIFHPKSEIFSPKIEICFEKPTMFSSKCSSGHVKCIFDDSVQKIRQRSKSFGSKCIFDDCWNNSTGSSINFAWKTKLNWKTNKFLIKTPHKVLGTLKMQLQQKWRNFFFKTNVSFAWVRSLKNQEIHSQKKPKKYFGHVECIFGNAADSFSQSSAQLSLKVQKLSKISENMIIILEVVHWTRRKQF